MSLSVINCWNGFTWLVVEWKEAQMMMAQHVIVDALESFHETIACVSRQKIYAVLIKASCRTRLNHKKERSILKKISSSVFAKEFFRKLATNGLNRRSSL
jgi:hypothetical protein